MKRFKTAATTLTAALVMGLSATFAQADLSGSDIAAINGKSGIRVYSSDGEFVGQTFGLRINGERTRLFLLSRSGSTFNLRGGRDVIITTHTDKLTLRGNQLVLDADERRLKVKAHTSGSSDNRITIHLLNR
ncbi:hypothetical protein [uncultured Tateyamaria sp.]|uniref:hypothetical protein n=1 Tax=uncultured Tateyamaria sp. TaxID=455651 RepID=UPI00263943B8|nr:hypothetical protein [uncultured Tateyamaria sp.]